MRIAATWMLVLVVGFSTGFGQKFRTGMFLSHSTGLSIWGPNGGTTTVPDEIAKYNSSHGLKGSDSVSITMNLWPVTPWINDWERWHRIFDNKDTLDADIRPILATNRIVMIKSCFPSSDIVDVGVPSDSLTPESKTIFNHKWHWRSFLRVMKSHPENFFVVWTNAPQIATGANAARYSEQFCRWAKDTLARGLDPVFGRFPKNVYVFDFFHMLTGSDGKLLLEYAASTSDNHPNGKATDLVAPQLVQEVFDAARAYENSTARLQLIHNAADPSAATVDVYLDGTKLIDNFGFRKATAYIDAPAGTPINIGVAGGNSSTAADTIRNFRLTLIPGETYVAVANGLLNPANFAVNPNGRSRAFTLFLQALGREKAVDTTKLEFFAVHGATDAPIVDVVARGVATLVNNAAYGDVTGYIAVPATSCTLDVKDSSGKVTVASFGADLSGLRKGTAVVFASGFLTPSANQNGPAFGMYAALSNGTVVGFGAVSSIRQQSGTVPLTHDLSQNSPNPFNPSTRIAFSIPTEGFVKLVVYNALGQEVAVLVDGTFKPGTYRVAFNAQGLPSGSYFYKVQAGNYTATRKMLLLK